MTWIRTIAPDEAQGQLAGIYKAALARAGKVFNILRIMSLNPPVLQASMGLYVSAMQGESPLSRRERELIAVVVSQINHCRY